MRRFLFVFIIVLVILATDLILVSFHLSRSDAESSFTVASSRSPNAEGMQPLTTRVYVEQNGRLAKALKAEFVQRADAFGLQVVDDQPADDGQPLMVVTVKEQNIRWFAVTASAAVQVEAGYSDTGDLYFLGEDPAHFVTTDSGPALQFKGDYDYSDRSTGLISLPGYHDMLAEKLADQILKSLQDERAR